MINVAAFGGCGLHGPLGHLRRLRVGGFDFSDLGFRYSPFALSANANLQLLNFVTGELDIPEWIRRLTYGDATHAPSSAQGDRIFDVDVAAVEMSTPVEYMFEGFILNINRFEEVMIDELSHLAAEKKLISTWRSALMKGKEEVRAECADRLFGMMPKETEAEKNLARFVRETTTRILGVDEMTAAIGELRERMGKPTGLVIHNFQFLPDGRPVSWPAEFKDQSMEVAQRLGLPRLDFAPFVAQHGVSRVMAADRRHWEPSFYPRIAEHLYDFCAGILGRQTMREEIADARAQAMKTAAADLGAGENAFDALENASVHRAPALSHYLYDYESGGHLPQVEATIYVVLLLGQSWALGASADRTDLSPVTLQPEHPGHALMFDAGIRPNGRPVEGFVDLQEIASSAIRETVCSGMADHILRHCDDRFADKPQILFLSAALAGTTLSGIGISPESGFVRGSRQHGQALQYVARARQIAAAEGKRIEILAVCLIGGENDAQHKSINGSQVERQISLLQEHYDLDLRRITGQDEPIRMLVTQTNRSAADLAVSPVAAAQLQVQQSNPRVRCVGPTYCYPSEVREKGHSLYAKPMGYRRLGQMLGRFVIDDLWGAGREPVRVLDGYWIGPKTARLRFTRPIAIETQDTQVQVSDLGPGGGVTFDDGTPWCPAVEAVRTIKSHDFELEIELAAPPSGLRKRFLIAAMPTAKGENGNVGGARSAIRSRMPFDRDPLDGTDLFDWACMQEISIP